MSYQRKTYDDYEVQGDYGQGWECVACGETRREARLMLRDHRENEPRTPFRLKTVRVRIEQN